MFSCIKGDVSGLAFASTCAASFVTAQHEVAALICELMPCLHPKDSTVTSESAGLGSFSRTPGLAPSKSEP